jgi:polysaccharide biosynthesis/export protein
MKRSLLLQVVLLLVLGTGAEAQEQTPSTAGQATAAQDPVAPPAAPGGADTAPVTGLASGAPLQDYHIGPGDSLSVLFWREKEMSADVVVRPDGRVTLPVLNEVEVVGLTTEDMRDKITTLARKYMTDPRVSIVVRQIRSRYVFITGKIGRPGPYPLYGPMTVLQLISMAAGLQDYADKGKIVVVRHENGNQVRLPFNYKQVVKGKGLEQNITLQPGDTVVVP